MTGFALGRIFEMGENMHPCCVEPDEKRFVIFFGSFNKILGRGQELLIHRFHALGCERPRVLANLFAPSSEARIFFRIILFRGLAFEHATRFYCFAQLAGGIIREFGFFLDVQVIEIAKKLVEAMHAWEELVAVTQVVLAELAGHVAERLEQLGDGGVFFLEPLGCSRHANLGIAGTHRDLAGNKGCPAGGATLFDYFKKISLRGPLPAPPFLK